MSNTAKHYLDSAAAAAGATAPTGFGGLVPYYDVFVPQYLTKTDGSPVGRRQAQIIAQVHNLPLVRLGNNCWIDPELAAERLREAQIFAREEPRRGRGRPRKV
jgi:hypothetical protein